MDTAIIILKAQKGITLVSQNNRSLTNSFVEVKIILQATDVDVFPVQETFLKPDQSS